MNNISLIITLDRSLERSLSWINALAEDPYLSSSIPKILILNEDTESLRSHAEALLKPQQTFIVPNGDSKLENAQLASHYDPIFKSVRTRYFTVINVPTDTEGYLELLPTAVADAKARLADLDLPEELPLFAYLPLHRKIWIRSYLRLQLAQHVAPSPILTDYLGYLAILSGSHSFEAVDVNGSLAIQARSAIGRFNLSTPAPWKFEIGLYNTKRELVRSVPARASKRIDSSGRERWENLHADLPLDGIPSGNYRLRIRLDTPVDSLAISQSIRPTDGALASARTRSYWNGHQRTYFLFHTVRSGRQTWLTVQNATSEAGYGRWRRSLIRKDLRTFLMNRSAGRMRFYRLLRLLSAPLMRNKDIWIIGERQDTAQDNGFHFFRHMRQVHPERRVFYVIDRDSPQRSKVAPLGNVIAHSSLRHRFYMLHASVLANAYSTRHMTPRTWDQAGYTRHLAWRVGAIRVYLKHGIHMSTDLVKRGTGGYDLYLTALPKETEALRATSGYNAQLVETGLPRYDSLRAQPQTRTILFMPTWRRYLVPKLFGNTDESAVLYKGSTYEVFLRDFLSSPRLHKMLEDYDYHLQFLPHYNLQAETEGLPLPHERLALADPSVTPFQELLTRCDIFVTDYSSVQFDVAYVGTPILYYQFDREEFEKGHAMRSWFDYERDGFGDVVESLGSALDRLEGLMRAGGQRPEKYSKRVENTFRNVDTNNSARVVTAIDSLLVAYSNEISEART